MNIPVCPCPCVYLYFDLISTNGRREIDQLANDAYFFEVDVALKWMLKIKIDLFDDIYFF